MTTRRLLTVLGCAVAAVLVPAAPLASAGIPQYSVWNRLDMDHSNPAPEHERLSCSRGLVWACH